MKAFMLGVSMGMMAAMAIQNSKPKKHGKELWKEKIIKALE